MEFTQLERRLDFLDNQYRRERADLSQLRQRLDFRENEREELLKRIEGLEAELSSMRAESQRFDLLDNKIERFKSEISRSLEGQQKQQRQALKEVERAHSLEARSHTKAMSEVRRDMDRGRNLDEMVTLARSETERLGTILNSFQERVEMLTKQNDEQVRAIGYLEEQRRSDIKRIGELQNEISDLFKRLNTQVSKVEVLREQIPQFTEFQLALERNREAVQLEVERSHHQMAQTERQVKQWQEISDTVQRRLEDFETRMTRYAEHYQINQKSLDGLETFQERLTREQREFIELQRLAFDRQQRRIEEIEETQGKTLRDYSIDLDRKVNDLLKEFEHFRSSFVDVTPQLEDLRYQFNLLLKIIEEDAIARTISAKEWQSQFEQLATEGR